MKLTITKQNVIDAIKREPLACGLFVKLRPGLDAETRLTQRNCVVCVVGGIIRRHIKHPTRDRVERIASRNTSCEPVHWVINPNNEADLLITKGRYLNALSVKLEARNRPLQLPKVTKTQRNELISWVKANFPTDFEIDV